MKTTDQVLKAITKEHGEKYGNEKATTQQTYNNPRWSSIFARSSHGKGFQIINHKSNLDVTDLGKAFRGVIIGDKARASLSREFYTIGCDRKTDFPVCCSKDGEAPSVENPISTFCTTCPLNKKASNSPCKNYRTLVIAIYISPSQTLVATLEIRRDSLALYEQYFAKFKRHKVALWKVETEFSIEWVDAEPKINFRACKPIDPANLCDMEIFINSDLPQYIMNQI